MDDGGLEDSEKEEGKDDWGLGDSEKEKGSSHVTNVDSVMKMVGRNREASLTIFRLRGH